MRRTQFAAALAALLLLGAVSAPGAAQAAGNDQCGEYHGCVIYVPWPPRPGATR